MKGGLSMGVGIVVLCAPTRTTPGHFRRGGTCIPTIASANVAFGAPAKFGMWQGLGGDHHLCSTP